MNENAAVELAALFARELKRLGEEIDAFGDNDTALWTVRPGIANSAGNLALHLEGNLREYVGRQLGGSPYTRVRPLEFSTRDLPVAEVSGRIGAVAPAIPAVISNLSAEQLNAVYPENVLGDARTTRAFLMHLLWHLGYHVGQINYLRRIITSASH